MLNSSLKLFTLGSLTILLVACGGSNNDAPILTPAPEPIPDPTMTYSYTVTVTNLTAGQPFSPAAVILHNDGYMPFTLGSPASSSLEMLAESGANTALLADADIDTTVLATVSGAGPVGPGGSESIDIEVTLPATTMTAMQLSLVTMLVNTNDAITGATGLDLSGLNIGDSQSYMSGSYDAGTEANTESADTIPGPAGAGGAQEAFNAARDDTTDQVLAHSGAITMDDGLVTSALTAQHKWDNPTISIMITRTR